MGTNQKKLTAEEVISKLKDDGDFDKLRIKIIRKLKNNEELRNSIISVVKQSAAINHPGAEKMKHRELCDAIHEEVWGKVSPLISDSLWHIIKAGDGMKAEIRETVQSVYDKMLNPHQEKVDAGGQSAVSVPHHWPPTPMKTAHDSVCVTAGEHDGGNTIPNDDPKRHPGFSLQEHYTHDQQRVGHYSERNKSEYEIVSIKPKNDGGNQSSPPAFSAPPPAHPSEDGSDDDPDVPPGFG